MAGNASTRPVSRRFRHSEDLDFPEKSRADVWCRPHQEVTADDPEVSTMTQLSLP